MWQRWSRHFSHGQWRPGIDGLESYLALIRRDLERSLPTRREMRVTLVIPEHIASELLDVTLCDVETAGTLLAQLVETHGGDIRLLVREVLWVPSDAYLFRGAKGLSISSHGYVPALAKAEADQAVPIWLHTHPGKGASPLPSVRDKVVDEEIG